MRINIYSQELTDEVSVIAKTGLNLKGEEEVFKGIRLYLLSPEQLHSTVEDDDRSAITIWLPGSSYRKTRLVETLHWMADMVNGEI